MWRVIGRDARRRCWAALFVARAVATRPIVRIGFWSVSALEIPAADTSTSRATRSGNWIATSAAMYPPIEFPTRLTFSRPSLSQSAFTQRP
jgi:hypothetical protein